MLWELYQQSRIGRAGASADAAAESARGASQNARQNARDLVELETRVDQLNLINMALWSFLQDKLGLTDDQLEERVREIDLADGRLDGKVRATPTQCPSCGRTMSKRHARCLYCGVEAAGGGPFRGSA